MARSRARAVPALLGALLLAPLALGTGAGATVAPPSAPAAPALQVHALAPGPSGSGVARPVPIPSGSYALEWSQALIVYGGYPQAGYVFGEGGTMSVDDALGRVMLFGGEGSSGLSNITLDYNVTNGTFDPLGGPAPSARSNASVAFDPTMDRAILFGGLTGLRAQATVADTWVFDFTNESWQNVTGATAPPARENAAFAVDPATGTAVLEGGRTPAARLGNSTGLVLWNDTWSLNLTTLNWSLVPASGSPSPSFAASLAYDPADHGLYLFGGCGFACNGRVWSFDPGLAQWSPVASTGTPPVARGAAVWAWEANASDFLLFGGFQWNGSVPSPLGDLYRWDPSGHSWTGVGVSGGPGPDYGANAAWADFPGCVGLMVIGGNIAYSGPPGSAWALEPLGIAQPNCYPNGVAGGGGPPPPPCSNTSATLTVRVQDAATGQPIGMASVTVHGRCGSKSVVTDADGVATLIFPAPDQVNVSASATGFHSTYVRALLGGGGGTVGVNLTELPSLHVRCLGTNATATGFPLAGVSVIVAGSRVVGVSGTDGWVNVSGLALPGSTLDVSGSRAGYGPAAQTLALAYTGPMVTNLSLLANATLRVQVVDARNSTAVPYARLTITGTDPGGIAPTNYRAGPNGSLSVSLAGGNYSVSAGAPGFVNASATTFVPWVVTTVLTLALSPPYGANVSIVLVSAVDSSPIAFGHVALVGGPNRTTGPDGTANFTDLGPPGQFVFEGWAPGFQPGSVSAPLRNGLVVPRLLLPLHPVPACVPGSPAPGCPPAGKNASASFAGLLPTGPIALALLCAIPVGIVGIAAVLVLTGRGGLGTLRARGSGR